MELRENARTELKRYLDHIDSYENVFVCGSCWWGTYPVAVFTQLEKLDFTGKKVMALMTHEGSGLGNGPSEIAEICPDAQIMDGFAARGTEVGSSRDGVIIRILCLSLKKKSR